MTTQETITSKAETKPGPFTLAAAIPLNRFVPAEQARNVFHLTLPRGTPWEAVHDPRSWVAIGPRLNVGDHVWVTDDESTRLALYFVRGYAAGAFIDLLPLIDKNIAVAKHDNAAQAAPGWKVEHRGAHLKWTVVNPNGVVVRENINTREAALVTMNQLSLNGLRVPPQVIG